VKCHSGARCRPLSSTKLMVPVRQLLLPQRGQHQKRTRASRLPWQSALCRRAGPYSASGCRVHLRQHRAVPSGNRCCVLAHRIVEQRVALRSVYVRLCKQDVEDDGLRLLPAIPRSVHRAPSAARPATRDVPILADCIVNINDHDIGIGPQIFRMNANEKVGYAVLQRQQQAQATHSTAATKHDDQGDQQKGR